MAENDVKQEEEKPRGRQHLVDDTGRSDECIDLDFAIKCLNKNVSGDAELFMHLYGHQFLFNNALEQWMEFTGTHYRLDQTSSAEACIEDVAMYYQGAVDQLKDKAAKASDNERKGLWALVGKFEQRIFSLRNENRPAAVLRKAHSGPNPLAIVGDEIDTKPYLLACENTVIDLKTGAAQPGYQQQDLLRAAPTEWQGLDAPCDYWTSALFEIMGGDAEMVDFVHRLLGMAIIGAVEEKVFVVFSGPEGDNGITTILKVIQKTLGPLAGLIPSDMLVSGARQNSSGPTPDLMSLKGLRIAYASETEDGAKVSSAKVKLLTGNDMLTARWPHDKFPTNFDPTHTLFLLSNFKPRADSQDKAFWSRMINIPFNMRFVKNRAPEADNERPADPYLMNKLWDERPGILAWLVTGCLEYQKRGLDIPQKVRSEISQYQEGEDDIGAFIDHCLNVDSEAVSTSATELYNLFDKWWRRYFGRFPPKQRKFGGYMKTRFRSVKEGGIYRYYGVSINHQAVKDIEDSEGGAKKMW